jgi:hypothetical protein
MKLEHTMKEEDKKFLLELISTLKGIKVEVVIKLEKK